MVKQERRDGSRLKESKCAKWSKLKSHSSLPFSLQRRKSAPRTSRASTNRLDDHDQGHGDVEHEGIVTDDADHEEERHQPHVLP